MNNEREKSNMVQPSSVVFKLVNYDSPEIHRVGEFFTIWVLAWTDV